MQDKQSNFVFYNNLNGMWNFWMRHLENLRTLVLHSDNNWKVAQQASNKCTLKMTATMELYPFATERNVNYYNHINLVCIFDGKRMYHTVAPSVASNSLKWLKKIEMNARGEKILRWNEINDFLFIAMKFPHTKYILWK